eukprot:COSAG02_NODE_941_length_15750_cov_104.135582_4_plen_150_part_00
MRRGLALLPKHGHALLIVDEGASGVTNATLEMHWHMHTFANATVDSTGNTTVLNSFINGTRSHIDVALLNSNVLDCPGSTFTISEIVNGPDSNAKGWKDLGMRRVTISAPAHSCKRLAVVIGAGAASWRTGVRVYPIDQWETTGPVNAA